jgi:hypothetical protein
MLVVLEQIMEKLEFTEEEIESVCLELDIPITAFNGRESERRIIIDHWGNANIIACPGSGKTTVLLAKLLLLSRRMPFKDGRGICVLTHTNVAIDEIKSKLGDKADILFKHPNFFGTLQGFIGKFLLKKAVWSNYKAPVHIVDTEVFNRKLVSSFRKLDQFRSPLSGLLFNKAYDGKITIKEIEKNCFTNENQDNQGKNNYQKAKELLAELKCLKLLSKKGDMQYFQCKGVKAHNLPTNYAKQIELEKLIFDKHQQLMTDLSKKKEEILQKLWIDLTENKMYSFEDGNVVAGNKTESYKEFKRLKDDLYGAGFVSFRDAFELARVFICNNNAIPNIASKRFSYLFCDEMQDTQNHQMNIVDTVFNSNVVKQFYGDPDQAIFNGIAGGETAWNHKDEQFLKLEIKDSKRYSSAISECINPFKKELSDVVGKANWTSLKPVILLYDNPEDAIDLFYDEIKKNNLLQEKAFINWNRESSPFNIVGFIGKKPEQGNDKVTIHSYVSNYSRDTARKAMIFENLVSYFQKRSLEEIDKNGTRVYYDIFINAFIAVLALSTDETYTKTTLVNELKDTKPIFFNEYCFEVYRWIKEIESGKKEPLEIKKEFLTLLVKHGYKAPNHRFITDDNISSQVEFKNNSNIISKDDINIKIGTIHSVKGETHMATLLLENENHSKFESSYFFNDNSGNLFCGEKYKRPKSFIQLEGRLKTTYVAMSRPTHLLCVAMSRDKVGCTTCVGEKKANCKWTVIP